MTREANRTRGDSFDSAQHTTFQGSAREPEIWVLRNYALLPGRLAAVAVAELVGNALTMQLAIIAVQHWIIRTRARDDCFRAFKLSHLAGAALWVGMAAGLLRAA